MIIFILNGRLNSIIDDILINRLLEFLSQRGSRMTACKMF